jgi:hypothetical protein
LKIIVPVLAGLLIWSGLQITAVTTASGAQERLPAPSGARVDRHELMRVVERLSQPSFQGRRVGTEGNRLARQFVRDAFQQIGLTPAVPGFYQPFTIGPTPSNGRADGSATRSAPVNGANVLGMQRGRREAARWFVVSAHFDHMGVANGVIYPGADDNASGVAALLAVARYVHAHPLAHGVVFAAFDAEEAGLQGAKAFVRTPPVPLPAIGLEVNFDMVSRNDRNEIYAAGTFQNPSLLPILADAQRRTPVAIRFGHDRPKARESDAEDWTLQSDHGPFHQAGVPFIYFGVEDHPDYHKPTDTADRIDQTFFGNVADMLLDFVLTADTTLP